MGTFPGHVLPGTLFLGVGMWHVWCSIVRYVSNPESFEVRVWNPVPGFNGKLKYLELYVIVVGGFIDLCIEFLYATHLTIFVKGVLNPYHMNSFEHSGMLLMFFIFGVITLLSETTKFLALPGEALCFIASAAFTAEYLLFYFHSTTHKGLEGYYHHILVLLVGLCIVSTIAGAIMPTSFPVDLCSAVAITLQGLWFYQTAFALYGPMIPDGCLLKGDMITCHSTEHEVHGELLANFQLFVQVLCVLGGAAGVYVYAEPRFGRSGLVDSRVPDDEH
ncbi:transmembrane protein 45a [Phtheirospermum japonicum]|uniref:Transmembrane protein 45a n=1 Tax=Phtheirospermum japonicum TaxID=374723 RepID=A0A830CN70_9LAMI|nr:transmembrane protein 45a [Phtheirospermum japonicum]